ncbi:substrate-binding periplasmic protein [Terasakiella pusilla]|uniref:substrate-binding periplasmic protein n=1 Tax=Terasakiella pusilla TaxID=64973 RepID=UPI003AA9CAA2
MGKIFKKYIVLTLTLSVFLVLPCAAKAEQYRFVTGFLPPWSMSTDPEYPGSFVEIAREIDLRLGNQTKIEVYPWARALELAQEGRNIIIFPLGRTAERENHFTWIDVIKPMEMVFVSLKSKVHSFEEAREFKRVLVHKGAPPDHQLEESNFKNLAKIPSLTPAIPRMLAHDRADAWYTPKDMAHWMWKLNPEMDVPYFSEPYSNVDLTFAGSPTLSPVIVERVRRILGDLKREKYLEKVIERYKR